MATPSATMHSNLDRTTHEVLALALPEFGVTHLFGLVGDANLFLVNAFIASGKGRYIPCYHEANAVLAALGFAQVTGRTGIATITHGPALTNAITALAEGAKGNLPLVLLCGDTAPGDVQHLQKIDQRPLILAAGAGFVEMRSPETAVEDLASAFRLAAGERRPVVFNMRVDLQWEKAAPRPPVLLSTDVPMAAARGEALEEAVGMLASARRPLILAGRGATDEATRAALVALSQRIGAPLATTLKAQGAFHGHPFDIGICGGLSHPVALETIVQSDCILAFGASLSRHTTESGAYTKGKRVIQVLADGRENARMTLPTLRLIGHLADTAKAMIALLDMAEIPSAGVTEAALEQRLTEQMAALATPLPFKPTAEGTLDMVPALQRLNAALPAERVMVSDLGRFVTTAWRCLPVSRPADLVYTCHFGAIGCGLGEAIGAATATEDRPTVLIAGDGGFMLSGLSELATAIREKLRLVVIIANDGSYGAEHIQFTNRVMDPALSLISPPDFAAVAQAMGMRAVCVSDQATLEQACEALHSGVFPLLIDLRLDPTRIEL